MLVGYDNDWRNADNMPMALYNDVPAGKHIFKVRAFLLESPDQYDVRTIEVEVEGRLTLRAIIGWIAAIIALLCVLAVIYIYRSKLIKKPLQTLEKIKENVEKKDDEEEEDSYELIDVDKLEES